MREGSLHLHPWAWCGVVQWLERGICSADSPISRQLGHLYAFSNLLWAESVHISGPFSHQMACLHPLTVRILPDCRAAFVLFTGVSHSFSLVGVSHLHAVQLKLFLFLLLM